MENIYCECAILQFKEHGYFYAIQTERHSY